MMRTRLPLLLLLSALLWSPARPALAAEPAPEAAAAAAARYYQQGVERFDAHEYQAALSLFRAAYDASESPNARIYVARCLRELGQLAAAYDEMHATVRAATLAAEQDGKYVPTRDAAAAELAMLEPRVGKLVVALRAEVEGTTVRLNDAPLGRDRLGVPITLLPGAQTIVVEAPGRVAARRVVELPGGQTSAVTVEPGAPVGAGAGETPPVESVAAPADEPETTGGGVRIAGYVVAGLGVAAMAVMLGTNLAADGELATLEDACGAGPCADPSYADTIDRGQTLETVANVSLVAGAVLIAGGVGMIIFGGPTEAEPAAASVALAPMVGPTGGYLGAHGRF